MGSCRSPSERILCNSFQRRNALQQSRSLAILHCSEIDGNGGHVVLRARGLRHFLHLLKTHEIFLISPHARDRPQETNSAIMSCVFYVCVLFSELLLRVRCQCAGKKSHCLGSASSGLDWPDTIFSSNLESQKKIPITHLLEHRFIEPGGHWRVALLTVHIADRLACLCWWVRRENGLLQRRNMSAARTTLWQSCWRSSWITPSVWSVQDTCKRGRRLNNRRWLRACSRRAILGRAVVNVGECHGAPWARVSSVWRWCAWLIWGGIRQRHAVRIARLLEHCRLHGVIDECTQSVDTTRSWMLRTVSTTIEKGPLLESKKNVTSIEVSSVPGGLIHARDVKKPRVPGGPIHGGEAKPGVFGGQIIHGGETRPGVLGGLIRGWGVQSAIAHNPAQSPIHVLNVVLSSA